MAKKKKAKKFNPKTRVMSAMRKIWLYSPMRREAVKRCKVGDNYRCERCRKLCDKVQIDHNPPVILLTGFDSWDGVFTRMFAPADTNLAGLCESCHTKLTTSQREERKRNKKK